MADYTANGRRSSATLAFRLAPLREAFGQEKARDVKAASIKRYTDRRLAAGKAHATINRELAALRRAFTIAVEQERLSSASVPRVKLFAEHNARQGFVERADFDAVVSRLPGYLQDYARFAYGSGWRKGEVATLEWSAVDKGTTRVTLRREHSKNGEPRGLPLVGELTEIIARRRQECAHTTVAGETAESSRGTSSIGTAPGSATSARRGPPPASAPGSRNRRCVATGAQCSTARASPS